MQTLGGGVLTQKKPKKPVATPKSANWHWLFLVFFGFLKFPNWHWFFWVFFGFFGIGFGQNSKLETGFFCFFFWVFLFFFLFFLVFLA